MINKEKIMRVDIYNSNSGERVLTTKAVSFLKDFFGLRGWELVSVKAVDLPVLHKDQQITVVFEYLNGTRIQCDTKVDISTKDQLNFHVDDGFVLEERRSSYKVATPNAHGFIDRIEKSDEEIIDLEEDLQVDIININLTGVFMNCEVGLKKGEIVNLKLLDATIEMRTEILRTQYNENGEILGYGCKFLNINQSQEEKIARYIFDCQLAERDRRREERKRL